MANLSLFLSRVQVVTGILLVVAAFLLNPWFLESHIVLDGSLNHKTYVLAANLALLAAGVFLIICARTLRTAYVEARSFKMALSLLCFSIGTSLLIGEVAARLLLEPQCLFSYDEDDRGC